MIIEAASTIINVQRRLLQLLAVIKTVASDVVLARFTAVFGASLLAMTVHVGLVVEQGLFSVLIVEVVFCEVWAHVYLIVVLLIATISLLHVVVVADVHI